MKVKVRAKNMGVSGRNVPWVGRVANGQIFEMEQHQAEAVVSANRERYELVDDEGNVIPLVPVAAPEAAPAGDVTATEGETDA